jgi:methionyl aminopeptidase
MIINLKSPDEIQKFIKAGKIVAEIMHEIKPDLKVDVSGDYIDNRVKLECTRRGAIPAFFGYEGFPNTCCFSVNNTLVHGIPNKTKLKKGDVVSLDIGVDIDGFYGDHAITIEIETSDHLKIINTCEQSLNILISSLKPGMRFSKIPEIIQKNSGNYGIIGNYGGHGVSRGILHDEPFVPNVDNFVFEDFDLRENMVFAVEPMLTYGSTDTRLSKDGWTVFTDKISVHFEHMVLITKDGAKILTEIERS